MSGSRHSHAEPAADRKPDNMFAEFLNPNSMITPGAAGAFTMVITNTLCQQFAQLPLNYTGLAVSFMFGAVVFGYGASVMARVIYFLINSLIIFVVAAGSSSVGARITHEEQTAAASTTVTQRIQRSMKTDTASSDSSDQKSNPPKPPPQNPPEKPKFFRTWL
jgi:large-conductance mechanosensitive channel